MRNFHFITFLLGCVLSVLISSCDGSKVYDTMLDLDSNAWNENQALEYKFTIEDTASFYTIYYTFRYDDKYPFYNLYIHRTLEDSSGKFISKKLQGMDLFNSTTGVPFGGGIGTSKDYMVLSEENYKFPYSGNYTVKLSQYMRQESLLGISAVGFRIEKINSQP